MDELRESNDVTVYERYFFFSSNITKTFASFVLHFWTDFIGRVGLANVKKKTPPQSTSPISSRLPVSERCAEAVSIATGRRRPTVLQQGAIDGSVWAGVYVQGQVPAALAKKKKGQERRFCGSKGLL